MMVMSPILGLLIGMLYILLAIALAVFCIPPLLKESKQRPSRSDQPKPLPLSLQKAMLAWDSAKSSFRLNKAALRTLWQMYDVARRNQTDFTTRNHPENDPAYRSVEFPDEFPP